MLNEKLKDNYLFSDEQDKKEDQIRKAKRMLNSAVRSLIGSMKAVEMDGVMTHEEIEHFVLARMKHYEEKICPMSEEQFNDWIADELARNLFKVVMSRD